MRSGNGRHRRPRQAPAIVVAAGVTGSALALPLLAAGSASAADAATWDRVAECESGGQWSANFGNGLYGGLQFTQEGWERHGGLAYATSADYASRAQQIAVAEKALAAGDTQWDTCAPIAGLTNDGTAPEVDPGPAVTPAPTGPVYGSNRTEGLPAGPEAVPTQPETTRTTPAGPTTPATPDASAPSDAPISGATPETSVTPSTPAAPGTGKHRGDAAKEESGTTDKVDDSGRHAAPVDGPDAPTSDVTGGEGSNNPDTTDTSDATGIAGEYTVKPGDSLSEIAQQNELPGGWTSLYDANRQTVGADPDLIHPGQSLDLTIGLPQKAK
ncbi:transglycosylase family protein [Streptomyces vilmorinianum]|uniref:LysM peptidoglycan-binding domain-containing protein n=1 Tax=Streptomyces vilmorinianum TaxID=3051092 RepID=UPI0010FB2CA4|nr:transglycosylase family protein [Streptomyces vilmorinianum]